MGILIYPGMILGLFSTIFISYDVYLSLFWPTVVAMIAMPFIRSSIRYSMFRRRLRRMWDEHDLTTGPGTDKLRALYVSLMDEIEAKIESTIWIRFRERYKLSEELEIARGFHFGICTVQERIPGHPMQIQKAKTDREVRRIIAEQKANGTYLSLEERIRRNRTPDQVRRDEKKESKARRKAMRKEVRRGQSKQLLKDIAAAGIGFTAGLIHGYTRDTNRQWQVFDDKKKR